MVFRPVTITEPAGSPSPLVVDSPHSGRVYPADFAYTCPLHLLRQTEDFMVDELVAGAVRAGATLVAANRWDFALGACQRHQPRCDRAL